MAEAAESFAFPVVPCAHVDRGEGFAAARDLQAGELVLRVAPLAAVPKDAYITRVCANCFQPGHPSSCSAGTSAPAGPLPSHTGSHAEGTGGAGSAVVAAAGAEPAAPSALKLCTACEAVSYCSRCLRLEKVQANHKQECAALGALLRMHKSLNPNPTVSEETHSGGGEDHRPLKTSRRKGRGREADGPKGQGQGAVHTAPVGASGQGRVADHGLGAAEEGTATLRLVLSIACWVARARLQAQSQQGRRRQPRQPTGPAGSGHLPAPSAAGRGQDDGGGAQELLDDDEAGGDDGRYGVDDVIEDSLEELEQLMGDPEEDLPPELLTRFTMACTALKLVQPAWARASLASYLRWATKVHFNEHDICISMGPAAAAAAGERGAVAQHSGAAAGAEAGQPVGVAQGTRGRPKAGKQQQQQQPQQGGKVGVACAVFTLKEEQTQVGLQAGSGNCRSKRRRSAGVYSTPPSAPAATAASEVCASESAPANGGEHADSSGNTQAQAVGEGLFPSVARLNHSCAPNCRLRYDQYGCLVVRTVQPVAKGEELFAAYVDPQLPVQARRQHLYERYRFLCACPACSAALKD